MAFFVEGFLELFSLRYETYQREWELANAPEPPARKLETTE